MFSRETIEAEICFYEKLRRKISTGLRAFPKGNLYFKMEHGRMRPYVRIDGKERYLSAAKKALLQGLMNRAASEDALGRIDENLHALRVMKEQYHALEHVLPDHVEIKGLRLSRNQISEITDRWAERRRTSYLPAELFVPPGSEHRTRKFRTSDGIYVKSKSELFIYEYLKAHGVPFQYEQPIEINGRIRYPDFTILRKRDGKVFLWEHFGMMELEWYAQEAERKMYDYTCAGYWPYKNFITTFEFRDGELDAAEIERILQLFDII